MAYSSEPSETPVDIPSGPHEWHRVLDREELDVRRVTTVAVGRRTLCVTNIDGRYGAMDNHCPHQGGPLGEGSIEKGWLRCPWHGFDYSPCNGKPPGGFDDAPQAYATQVRDDGVYVALPPEEDPPRSVSNVMVDTMINWGVDAVFGMVGHSNLGFADAMRTAEARGDLRYFGIRHEGAAAFAATAYGKLTGRLSACFGIAGPGSTNLLTGLYDAKVDRAPVLALSGQVPSKDKGRGAFQDLDLEGAFADVAAFSETIHAGADPAEIMSLACKTALVERNVAHIVLPDEVQVLASDVEPSGPTGRVGSRLIAPPADVLAEALSMIAAASRPLIIVGAGARHEMAQVLQFAEHIGAPVATTFKGKGLISDSHPLGCGVLGRSGTPIASWFMNESDLVIVFGASFSNHTGIASYKPIIQVDDDPMSLGRFHSVDVPMQANVGVAAAALINGLGADADRHDFSAEVAERWAIWRAEKAQRVDDDRGQGIGAAVLFETLSDHVPDDAVICVDVGNNTYSFGRYFEVTNQDVLMSGYLGSIGFGFPAAMGAWAAVGADRKVVSVSGDGGFGQYAMDFTTAVKYEMNITHVLMNNAQLGKISKEQRAAHFDVWQTSLVNPNFADFATLCGGLGIRVTDPADLNEALAQAMAHDGPALVEVITDAQLL
ncbi:MAG: Rieske 2Fe-2S domain-containing protein [Acidimicrobiaceae bacterium]|nr:Rieske 2Fe-2S domain-containing protein [Acidimicrobiaceae bacterium]